MHCRAGVLACLLYVCAASGQVLPGTHPLTLEGDLADRMLSGMDQWLLRELAASPARRNKQVTSIEEKRKRFAKIVGVVDKRIPFETLVLDATLTQPALVAETKSYKVWAVRWPVLDGLYGEGLLLEPAQAPVARVVALPDADWTPEMLVGLAPGVPVSAQFARRLAENGCLVLVPVLLDRQPVGQYGPATRRPTNQTRREFVYRMARGALIAVVVVICTTAGILSKTGSVGGTVDVIASLTALGLGLICAFCGARLAYLNAEQV